MRSTRLFPSARPRRVRPFLIAACVLGAATAVVVAEQKTVKRPRAEVLDAKGSAGDVIETVPRDGSLEVLNRESPWVKVRTATGKVGYVTDAVFEPISASPDLLGSTAGKNASPTEASAAGKGWDPEVEGYVSSNHLNRKGLEEMEKMRAECRGKPMREFQKAGKLGGAN